ncbi:MAG: UDP-N-acetylglucosamine--N-acetylmuramyl-(pentapeptide) pyrophosphoryl-undecaprenol N-acetylglucosamine transferase [Myxococcota bacterium]|jgi:UDP-N-acetylglucosamine--N-acetylmuramyl-(pentapeptide) pyrophosphoryl-undecaprenol N-acetylglucosamine transferase
MPLRIVSYAINGRGMGHLVRQLAILRWVRRYGALLDVSVECWVLTSSEADTLARREGIPSLKMPSKAMMRDANIDPHRYLSIARGWVLNAIAGLQPDVLIVDTFPAGSFGELVTVLELARTRVLVRRRVKESFAEEEAYQALLPLYDRCISPDDRETGPIVIREREELLPRPAARRALGIPDNTRAVYLSLGGGGDPAAAQLLPRAVRLLRASSWHVVVGAGPLYEGEELRGEGITWLDRYVPVELFAGVDAAVSAGGYNSYHELMYAGVPTVFLPQPRIADDQAARVDRAVAAGAGRRAARLEDVPALLEDPGSAEAARGLVPDNGARRAAAEVLSLVAPPEDVAHAVRIFTPALIGRLESGGWGLSQGLAAAKLLTGASPSALARRTALIEDPPPEGDPAGRVDAFFALCAEHEAPPDLALSLLAALHRKFPAARGDTLIQGAGRLFAAWGRFDDWMGAVSLMRAVPTQRQLSLDDFATHLIAWLETQDELFDALRVLARTERHGERSIAETLTMLAKEAR